MKTLESIFLDGIVLAIIAHGLIGMSLIWDKVLLKRPETKNLVSYVFWLGAISIFGLVLIFFGFKWPGFGVSGMGFTAGVLDLVASYFYYSALKSGEASEELAAMGGFAPVATALIALPLLKQPVGGQLLGFTLLTVGGFVMFFAERQPLKMLPKIVMASACFGMSNVLQKMTFDHTNFVSGFVFFTLGTTIGAFALLIPPDWRRQIFEKSEQAPPSSKFWYMVNRFTAGVGSFLIVFAISKANPALVEAVSGVRYAVIFVGAYLVTQFRPQWFREDFSRWVLVTKVSATSLVVAGLVAIGLRGGAGAAGPQ